MYSSITKNLFFGIGLLISFALWGDTRPAPEPDTGRQSQQAVSAKEYMVVAAHPQASYAGFDILRRGGNAIDAMVAVQFMLNLVEPQSSGIGGGAFLMYWDAGQNRLYSFDGRETAPAAVTGDYFLNLDGKPLSFWEAVVGGRSVGVPGTLKLLEETHQRFGSLPWADLLQPTINLAERGFFISPRLQRSIAQAKDYYLDLFPDTKAYFFKPDGSTKTAGTRLKNPEFAQTLRLLANGSQPFYRGQLAKDIVKAIKTSHNPGVMDMTDLAEYKVKQREPICVSYRGDKICGMGPPSSGALTIGQMLGILTHFDMASMQREDAVHVFLESAKLAYADRSKYMADGDFSPVPVEGLLDAVYLKDRMQRINVHLAMDKAQAGNPFPPYLSWGTDQSLDRQGTSHFVIRDRYGNAVSMTTTIETGFGSRLMVGGFLLNNELTDFSFISEMDGNLVANRIQPRKRPRSSMSPTIVFRRGEPFLLIGSPGGSQIINYVAQALVGILDWDMDIQAALDMYHFSNRNDITALEPGIDRTLIGVLESKGHEIEFSELNSGTHAILIHTQGIQGAADPRREGMVLGR